MPKAVSPELLAFKAELDLHRQSHPPRARLPEHLWQQAVALLARHSISAVCRVTNLHQDGLRRQALRAGVIAAAATTPSSAAPQFITLQMPDPQSPVTALAPPTPPPNAPSDAAATAAPAYLALERADGSRLTLCVPAPDGARIEALCALFLRS